MHALAVLLLLVQAPVLRQDGLQFKDLNRNGVLDPYEDWRLSPDQRARDLVARMTLEEKAGAMMHGTARSTGPTGFAGMGAQYDTAANRALIDGIAPEAASREGWTVVHAPSQADVAIMRLSAPFETLHPEYVMAAFMHEGSLAFKDGDPDFDTFKRVSAAVPTIVTVYLDRPAILTPLKDRARALIANFGVSDAALMDVAAIRCGPTCGTSMRPSASPCSSPRTIWTRPTAWRIASR